MIWFEVNAKGMFQLLGVAAIVDAAVTILVPIFRRLSTAQLAPASGDAPALDLVAIDREIEHIRVRRLGTLPVHNQAMTMSRDRPPHATERAPYTTQRFQHESPL